MLTAQVTDWASSPKLTTVDLPATPPPSTIRVRVRATGLHQVVRSRAAGTHYTSGPLPHTPGVDGTGVDVSTGKNVFFSVLGLPGGRGTFVEYLDLPPQSVVELPEGVDPVVAAAMLNPVMSGWMALRGRVEWLREGRERSGWTVVILGVTTVSGQMAIRVARSMGATKVIGAARNEAALKDLPLDGYVVLKDDAEETQWAGTGAAEADVVLDYLYGPWPGSYLAGTAEEAKAKQGGGVTYVNIGSMAGGSGEVPSAALRSRDVTMRGSGPGAWDPRTLGAQMGGMLGVLKGVGRDGIKEFALKDVEEGWAWKGKGRVVFVTEE